MTKRPHHKNLRPRLAPIEPLEERRLLSVSNPEVSVEISQNGCFGVFTQKICLRGGKTKEQINLDKYMMQNKKIRFNFNKFYIHQNGKPYELWGYTDKRRKNPFVVINTNNIYDNVLLSEDKVMRFFT